MRSARKKEDRRRSPRIDCKNVIVNYRKVGLLRRVMNRAPSLDDKSKCQPVLNISRTGMSFLTEERLKKGQELLMRISFGPRRPNLEVNGEVAWREEGKGQYPYTVGMRFVDVTPSAWNKLLHLSKFVTSPDKSDAWSLRGEEGTSKAKSWSERSKPNKRDSVLRERFLTMTSEVNVERLKTMLDGRKKTPGEGEVSSESGDARLRSELESLCDAVDDINIDKNPLQAFLRLEEVGDRFSCMTEVQLPDELDRRRDILKRKIENKREGLGRHWNERSQRAARSIANLGRRVDRILNMMIVKIQRSANKKEGQSWAGITDYAQELSEVMRRIKALVDGLPDGKCGDLPFWDLLKEAQENLLKPHRRNVFLFKCAAAMAHADGALNAYDRDFLGAIADELHLSAEEEKKLIQRAQNLGSGKITLPPEEAREIIHKLYLCSLTDSEMSAAEVEVLKKIGDSWGVSEEEVVEMLEERKQLERLCSEGVQLMRTLVKEIEDGNITERVRTANRFNKGVDKLAAIIRRIENKVSDIPEMRLRDLPDWDVLKSARQDIIRPHAQNLFLLKAAIRMTVTDGEATEPEEDFLHLIVDNMQVPRSMAEKLLEKPEEVEIPEFYGSRKEARAMVQKLYRCALADGTVEPAEKEFLEDIARELGVSRPEVVEEMTNRDGENDALFLDRAAVMEWLCEQEELAEGIKVGEDIDEGIRGYIHDNFRMPEGMPILMTYENHMMGDMLECGALTPHCLFLRTPDDTKESVKIADMNGVEADAVGTFLLLDEKRHVQMSRMAEPFIHLVIDCIRERQRPL